ncbi:putative Insecticidal toxin complex protein TccB2 [Orbilia brochopaga]|uniref:Insecticidal toxin complex protein TccB2 n=1 Tax=Orbilia brochopaga TaxID=3140254 RepID=A0AAV9V7F3_9PEZI
MLLSPQVTALLHSIAGDGGSDNSYSVSGTVTYPSGEPAPGLLVIAYDKDLRSKQELGRSATDSKGAYSVKYTPDKFARSEKGSADLSMLVSTRASSEVLFQTAVADVYYNAPAQATIDIQISALPKGYCDDEFSNILRTITPLLDGAKIEDLTEDAENSDITFLNKETGIEVDKLEQFVYAHQLAVKTKVSYPAFFYGVFREDGLQQSDAVQYGPQPVVQLGAAPAPIFYSIVLIPADKLKTLVDKAVNTDNYIPKSVADALPVILRLLSQYAAAAKKYWSAEPDNQNNSGENILKGPALDKLYNVLQTSSFGDLPSIIQGLQDGFTQPAPSLTAAAHFRFDAHVESAPVADKTLFNVTMRTLPKFDSQSIKSHVADLDQADWEKVLQNMHGSTPVPKEQLDVQVSQIMRATEIQFPTRSFVANMKRDNLKNHAFTNFANILSESQDNSPDFNFATLPLEKVQDLDPKVKANAASAQRLFKLSPKYTHTKRLFDVGFRSAADILQHAETRFTKMATAENIISETEAKEIYQKSYNLHTAAALLAGELQSVTGATRLAALGSSGTIETRKKLEAVTKDFPNMKSLFQLQDICACTDCASVHSASAYVTDTLTWLKNRLVIDSTASGGGGVKIARDVLFERRPDLIDLDLSCANTNTPLPYIDVVCELLEEAVASDPGFSFNGTKLTTGTKDGLISAELLTVLQEQSLDFTVNATVSNEYGAGNYRNVRDVNAVCKMIPDNADTPTKYQIYILKPTVGTADEVAAAPSYVNAAAYDVLAGASYIFALPFDINQAESQAYFGQFGIARNDLMQILQVGTNPQNFQIAYTALNLTSGEYQLIVTEDATDNQLTKFWNHSLSDLTVVSTFIDTAAIDYTTLLALLKLPWINSNTQDPLTVISKDPTSCDLAGKNIGNLDEPALDRFQRFLRLWKKLTTPQWTVQQLDQAIRGPTLGNQKLNEDFIVLVWQLNSLAAKLQAPLGEVITYFDTFPSDVYAKYFLNSKQTGTVNKDFDPTNVANNEQKEVDTPDSGAKLSAYNDYLAIAFAASGADIAILIGEITTNNRILSQKNLAQLFLLVRLCQLLKLKAADLSIMLRLTKVTLPFDTNTLPVFIDQCRDVAASGTTPTKLSYYLDTVDPDMLNDDAVTKILQTLQAAYQVQFIAYQPPFIESATAAENQAPVMNLLRQLNGLAESDIEIYKTLFTSGVWLQANGDVHDFIERTLPDTPHRSDIETAADNLIASTDPTKFDDLANALLEIIGSELSTYLYHKTKADILSTQLVTSLASQDDIIGAILDKAHLKQPSSLGSPLVSQVLLSDSLNKITPPTIAPGTPGNPSPFDAQYRAIRLLYIMIKFVSYMKIAAIDLSWFLDNNAALGWLEIDNLKYQDDVDSASFTAWRSLYHAILFATKYPPVENTSDSSNPYTFYGSINTTLADKPAYLAQLTGWDLATLNDLATYYSLADSDYHKPETHEKLDTALGYIRTLGLTLSATLAMIKAVLTSDDVKTLRTALKAKYSPNDWLGVLKSVQDPLRRQKRDALVAYLLAVNPTMTTSDDLYDYFLIDTQMGSCMSTSRVVQAHATIQLFVQRSLMGLEPQCIADVEEDPIWTQWEWMSAFRVWEASRKIFLWPENWLDPSLRLDKSQLFQDFESFIAQNPLTDDNVESAVSQYLENFDEIANLEVMACFYQTDIFTMHVIARTRGGDPFTYYYRQFLKERSWTPWEKIDLDIQGDAILAFDRNSRLNIAWLIFFEDKDPAQMRSSSAPTVATVNTGNYKTDAVRKRWKIQLAVSERIGTTWTPKKVSQGYLSHPPSYVDVSLLPDQNEYSTFEWDGSAISAAFGQAISVVRGPQYVGAFSLVGCKGYPEPTAGSSTSGLSIRPQFQGCNYVANRYQPTTNSQRLLSIATWFSSVGPNAWDDLLTNVQGAFKVAYPCQLTLIDWFLVLYQLFYNSRYTQRNIRAEYVASRILVIQLGAYLPYFFADYNRNYVVIPGFYNPHNDVYSPTEAYYTGADILKFFQDCLALFWEYINLLVEDPKRDLDALLVKLKEDPEFIRLKELIPLYSNQDKIFRRNNRFKNFYHPVVCAIRKALIKDGIAGMLARQTQLTNTGFNFTDTYKPTDEVSILRPMEDVDFTSEGAYSSYNWELFYHIPELVALKLSQDGQYDSARKWFQYIFNPTAGPDVEIPKRYWITKPFYQMTIDDYTNQRIDEIFLRIAKDPSHDGTSIPDLRFAVDQWRASVGQPDVVAKTRPVAYQIATVLAYVKNLTDWGDNLFRQFTRETVTQATQMYILADKLLGPKPRIVQPDKTPRISTFSQLESDLDIFGNALVDLENLVPNDPGHNPGPLPPPPPLRSLYFCIPPNENMLAYWDLVADRLFKIRNCQNIDGVQASLALFSPPIDPGALVRAIAGGLSVSSFLAGLSAPLPYYRFTSVAQKATELAQQASSLGNALLSALEKKDGEALAAIRSAQEIAVSQSMRVIKVSTIAEADGAITAAQLSKAVTQEKRDYFAGRDFMNGWEIASVALAGSSLLASGSIALAYILAGGLALIPNFVAGAAGFGGSPEVSGGYGGDNVGDSAANAAKTIEAIATTLSKASEMSSVQGSFQRRQDDWDHEVASADKELTQWDQQIANATLHKTTAQNDLATQDLMISNNKAIDTFLRSKFTNTDLYNWTSTQIYATYVSAYKTAFDMAKRAEQCFNYELGQADQSFVTFSLDTQKKGLLAADTLLAGIKTMESAYLNQNFREYELTKSISLALIDPQSLFQLRQAGKCGITISEPLFDLDHPGHYFRRIKSVALTIPCITGPYVSISCKLTQITNAYRASTSLGSSNNYPEDTTTPNSDTRFRYNLGSIQSIATSTAQSDTGTFELNFRDERYLPFEGTGAISQWLLELPDVVRQFDYSTITDAVITLRYTARDGGDNLRKTVEGIQRDNLNNLLTKAKVNGLYAAYVLPVTFPNEWWQLQNSTDHTTKITIQQRHLPFFTADHGPQIDNIYWFAVGTGATGAPNTLTVKINTEAEDTLTLAKADEGFGKHSYKGSSKDGVISLGTEFTLQMTNVAAVKELVLLFHYVLTS